MRNYNDPLYKKWRISVFKRDHFCCKFPNCNSKNKLNAHHIKKWSNYPILRYTLSNGITLCKFHHDIVKNKEEIYEQLFSRILVNEIHRNKRH